ncbi:MAG: glutamate-5-semialdehyde dehydrogenase [Planctomycetota bacterium]|nr:glutamate-5-semialdehyde dehydrogenase [Planctomycetota bacterium]
MSTTDQQDLVQYCEQVAQAARQASVEMVRCSIAQRNQWLTDSANQLRMRLDEILAANQKDLEAAPSYGLTDAQVDRLVLSEERVSGIAQALEEIAALEDPVGEVIESRDRPNGLKINKVRVPLGVVFFVYESRPNVTADAAAICIKSGNAVILRGGKEAAYSSRAIVEILTDTARQVGLPENTVQLVKPLDREAVGHFLQLDQYIDLAIPRGGEGLIRRVAAEAKMPVIKHFTGNCHVYVDQAADLEMARSIVVNSKCHRLGVCNACESMLVHEQVAAEFLPVVVEALQSQGIEIRGDEATRQHVQDIAAAAADDYGREYLGPIISVCIVDSVQAAIAHVNQYGSHHTDAIVSHDVEAIEAFTNEVDSSAVMVNASTRFNDGGEFGLGAEIGISTDKFHARGPCGLKELTTYKYVAYGDGQLRQ